MTKPLDPNRKKKKNPPKKVGSKEKRIILKVLADGWSEQLARKKVCIGLTAFQKFKKAHPAFVKKMEEAKWVGVTTLEDAAHKRGVKGVLEPVVSGGRIIAYKRRFSDGLLQKALEVRNPKYAVAKSTGEDFADTMVGAAERLLYKLDSIIEQAEAAERELCA